MQKVRHCGLERNDFLRFVFLTLTVLLCAAPAMAQAVPAFRYFIWDVGREDVRAFETAKWYKDDGESSFYVEQPDEFRRTIRYDFRNDKLWRAQFSYNELQYPTPFMVLDRAAAEQVELEKIYGLPTREEFIWNSPRYRPYPELLGSAFRMGDVRIRTTWELPDSKVVMESYNDGYEYQLYYTAEKLSAPEMDTSRNILNLPLGEESQP
jgi:hypothetical protein